MKSTNIEIQQRVDKILSLIVSGHSRSEIIQFAANTWGLCVRQTDEYCARVTKLLKIEYDLDRKHLISLAIRRMLIIYTKCTTDPTYWNPNAAISAQQEINKLLGLYSPVKVDMAVTDLTKKDKEDLNSIDDLEFANFEEVKG